MESSLHPRATEQERLSFQHLIHLKFAGEPVNLKLLRGGEELSVDVPVYPQARLVPSHIYDAPQAYFIYGGLAFVALTEPYLHEWGDEWMSDAPHELVSRSLVMGLVAIITCGCRLYGTWPQALWHAHARAHVVVGSITCGHRLYDVWSQAP